MSEPRSRDGFGATLVVLGLVLYVLSFGPANAFSRRHSLAWPVGLAMDAVYSPLYLAVELSSGFDHLMSRYCDFCGGELHGL